MTDGLLYLIPAILLALPLLFGRYPGESLLLGSPSRRPRRRAPAKASRFAPVLSLPLPRGGALLAAALAGRAPPFRSRRVTDAAQIGPSTCERKETMRRIALPIAALCALLAPAAAQAHVTLQPKEAPEGAYTVLDVRVPNESESANTTKVAVQFPEGFADVSYQAVPGWTTKVVHYELAKPVQTDDGPVTEGVREVVFSGGKLPPGQFQDFPLSLQIPGKAGEELTFKAVQTYDDGEVVRWIGAPEAEHPAPQVLVTSPEEEGHHATAAADEGGAASAATAGGSSDSGDGASKGLAITALVIGALGLIAGGAALLTSRRKGASAA